MLRKPHREWPRSPGDSFYIGVASRESGVHPSTIRLYESLGWIPAPERTAKGYRLFTNELVVRIKLTAGCLKLTALGPTIRPRALELIALNGEGAVTLLKEPAERLIEAVEEELRLAREAVRILSSYQARLYNEESSREFSPDILGEAGTSSRLRKIAEAAELCGVTPDQIRHWERNALLAIPRDPRSGYRLFAAEELERLLLIRLCIRSRFSLTAVRRVMRELDNALLPEGPASTDRSLEEIIDTPTNDELSFFSPFPTDRWISTLTDALGHARKAQEIIRRITTFY
jgi:DNA-binding transcriptional MerR regulator